MSQMMIKASNVKDFMLSHGCKSQCVDVLLKRLSEDGLPVHWEAGLMRYTLCPDFTIQIINLIASDYHKQDPSLVKAAFETSAIQFHMGFSSGMHDARLARDASDDRIGDHMFGRYQTFIAYTRTTYHQEHLNYAEGYVAGFTSVTSRTMV